jgi:hypothetical protein
MLPSRSPRVSVIFLRRAEGVNSDITEILENVGCGFQDFVIARAIRRFEAMGATNADPLENIGQFAERFFGFVVAVKES